MTYNTDHTIENKIQLHRRGVVSSYGAPLNDESVVQKNSYTLDYAEYATAAYVAGPNSYGYQQPHAVRKITEYPTWVSNPEPDDPRIRQKEIEYDANGNQTEIREKVGEVYTSLRKNLWDEENRLKGIDLKPDEDTDHPVAVYTYNVAGERIVRYNFDRLDVSSNAEEVGQQYKDNVMLYPSGLLMGKPSHVSSTLNRLTYTKHYYIGSERISAKTGTVTDLGLFPGEQVLNDSPSLTQSFVQGPSNQSVDEADQYVTNVHTELGVAPPNLPTIREEGKPRFNHIESMLNIFYFHKDHLGSSSYITNDVGNVTQHMEYLPFGETLADEHTNSFNSPFKFNGKEFDEETGNYYYGARYYDPKFSIFISVDPLAEKYPNWSSYAYCYNNPINFIDPTGMEGKDPWYKSLWNWAKRTVGIDGGSDYQQIPSDEEFGFNITLNDIQLTNSGKSSSRKPGDSWVANGNFYTQINTSTILINNPRTNTSSYGLSLPQDFGTWNTAGSDGMRWIGCMSCHAENGAYRYIAYNSKEHKLGLIGAMLIGAASPIPSPRFINASQGTTVLGHFPKYVNLAERMGASKFQIPPSIWNKMSAAEQWTANTKFLDRMILRGDNIRLATPFNKAKPGSFFERELNYLFERGYKVSSDGRWLIK